jgi:hypothetical protein
MFATAHGGPFAFKLSLKANRICAIRKMFCHRILNVNIVVATGRQFRNNIVILLLLSENNFYNCIVPAQVGILL